MVCGRCKTTVTDVLDRLEIKYVSVELGEVTIRKNLTPLQHNSLSLALEHTGFELIDNEKYNLIKRLKRAISVLEINSDGDLKTSFPDFISQKVNYNFMSLNDLFSEIEGISIEKYIINQKVELVKVMLGYNSLDISEIATKMHYSNVAQLSTEFKSVTGLTPLHFRQSRNIS